LKSIELPPRETRLLLDSYVLAGELLHGSPVEGLAVLHAQSTANLAVHNDTGEQHTPEVRVNATDIVDLAIMYAVLALSRDHKAYRAVSIDGIRDGDGIVAAYRYFASDRMKEIMRERQGRVGAAYRLAPPMQYSAREREWYVTHDVAPRGSLVVRLASLSFNFFDLPSPDSAPKIHGYYEEFGIPAETPPLLHTDNS
jgi:hypothetical protein